MDLKLVLASRNEVGLGLKGAKAGEAGVSDLGRLLAGHGRDDSLSG